MNSSLKYNDLIKVYIKPLLKEYGFSLKGYTFITKIDSNYGLIDFQKSRKSKNDIIIFTINIGILSTRLIDFFSQNIKAPSIEDCHWRQRIGFLHPDNSDKWWQIDSETNINDLFKEIEKYLIQYTVAAIRKNIHDEDLINLWCTGKSPGLTDIQRLINLSALIKKVGTYDVLLLDRIINEMYQSSINKPVFKIVESLIEKLKKEE